MSPYGTGNGKRRVRAGDAIGGLFARPDESVDQQGAGHTDDELSL